MSEVFDPSVIENLIVEGAHDTSRTPVPEGSYKAIAEEAKVEKRQGRDDNTVYVLRITWKLEDEDGKLAELMNMEDIRVRQDIWLDLVNGALSTARNMNIGLGKLRAAIGLNDPKRPFQLPMIIGRQATVTVSHRQDRNDSSVVYDQVTAAHPYSN